MFSAAALSQNPPYRGPSTRIEGVFVTPVPNAPFTATVTLQSSQPLPDGSTLSKKTLNYIARDSGGRIHNEYRMLVPDGFSGKPHLISTHIYDPVTRVNTFLNAATRLARQAVLPAPMSTSVPMPAKVTNNPLIKDEDLGTQTMENVIVHGTRRSTTVPERASGTGKAVVVVDEYIPIFPRVITSSPGCKARAPLSASGVAVEHDFNTLDC